MFAIGAVAAIVAATGSLAAIAAAAAFAILVYYGIANLAALKMPTGAKLYPDAVPLVGLAGCAGLAVSLAPVTIAVGALLLAGGFLVRWLVRTAA